MKNMQKIILLVVCIIANVVLGELVMFLKLPLLFLDTVGTILITAQAGLLYGLAAAAGTHVLLAIISGPTELPFVLVSIACAVVVAFLSRDGFPFDRAIVTGLVLSVVTPLIAAPIRILLFDGLTGSGGDVIIRAMIMVGHEVFSSTFIGTITNNFVDKTLSCILVVAAMKALPAARRA